MSYKSREKKRRKKIATGNVREKHGETMKARHYLTITTRACCCNGCGRGLRTGDESVFRFEPKEIVCLSCAELRKLHYRPSQRWEKAKAKKKGRPTS